MTGTSQII